LIEPAIPEIKKNIGKDHERIDNVKLYDQVHIIENLVHNTGKISYENNEQENDAFPF
jgi:hypothetical protein